MKTEKEKALEIYNKHYIALFDSESDKGEEILVSILAKENAIITVDEAIFFSSKENVKYLHGVKKEIEYI